MSQDPYKSAKKEMDMLLKMEGGVNLSERDKKQRISNKMIAGEEAGRLAETSLPNYVPGTTDEDFELGTGDMPSVADFRKSMAERAGLDYIELSEFDLKDEELIEKVTAYIPGEIARERRVFPVAIDEKDGVTELTVAIADPFDITVVDDLRLMLPDLEVRPIVSKEEDIVDAIEDHYGIEGEDLDQVIDILKTEEGGTSEGGAREGEHAISLEELANKPPVVKLVNLLLIQSVKDRASDIHIEPFSGMLRIRYRVDGVLREIPSPPKSLQIGLITRLKVMGSLNISESRRPQDGRIRLNIEGREVDLRVACVPTVHGESMVMRVLDKSAMMIGIEQLGMQKEVLDPLLSRCRKPNGLVLVTGPTGCGKTTTLYASLREIFDPGEKFITTEDPVEYELPGIVQVNINAKVGLTFAACLRSILRQDPDRILVGEIRDIETAQISIQAALTGHLVMSTLHTNSAAATVTRLIDMGVQPFLLTSTLEGVMGQRLLRTICPTCRTPYIPTDEELFEFGVTRDEVEDADFYHGRGCEDCNFTGYKGRQGIFEFLECEDSIRELILQNATTDDIHAMAVHEGMITMRQDGWLKICLGVSTFEEVSKHTIPETEETIRAEMDSVRRSKAKIAEAQKQRDEEENAGFGGLEGDDDGGGEGDEPVIDFQESADGGEGGLLGPDLGDDDENNPTMLE